MSRFFAALYVTEAWHAKWINDGSLYAKTRAVVLFDRILTGQMSRIQLNGMPLDRIIGQEGK